MNQFKDDDSMDLEQVKEYLKAGEDVVLGLVGSGNLPGAKIGKRWVFVFSDVRDYLVSEIKDQTHKRRERLLGDGRIMKGRKACDTIMM